MAQYYKGHARGGSFKGRRLEGTGDRFKEQQDLIIQSLKLQQQRSNEYNDEYVRGLESNHESERWNRQILDKLENDAYETRRRAVELRGKREVEALQGKAREYERKSQFWQDFSKTYAKQWGELAAGATDAVGALQAKQHMKDLETDENGKTKIDTALEQATLLITKQANEETEKAIKDGDINKASSVNEVPTLAKYYVGKRFSTYVNDHWDEILSEIQGTVDDLDFYENPQAYIGNFIEILAQQWGLDPNGAGVRDAVRFGKQKGSAIDVTRNLNHDLIKRQGIQDTNAQTLYSLRKSEGVTEEQIVESFNALKLSSALLLQKDSNGRITRPNPSSFDNKSGLIPAFEKMINDKQFDSAEDISKFYHTVIPSPYWNTADIKLLEDKFLSNYKKDKEREKGLFEVNDAKNKEALIARNLDFTDFGVDGDRQEAINLLTTAGPITTKWLAERLEYHSELSYNEQRTAEHLLKAAHLGNWDAFMFHYSKLDKAAREPYKRKYEVLLQLQDHGHTAAKVKELAKTAIQGVSKVDTLSGGRAHISEEGAIEGWELTFWNHFNNSEHDNVAKKWTEAIEKTTDDLLVKEGDGTIVGRGLLRRRKPRDLDDAGSGPVWLAYAAEEGDTIQKKDIAVKYRDSLVIDRTNTLDTFLKDNPNIISNDQFDMIVKELTQGKALSQSHENIIELTNIVNETSPTPVSRADVLNALLKSRGITNIKVNPGPQDEAVKILSKENIKPSKSERTNVIKSGYLQLQQINLQQVDPTSLWPWNLMRPELKEKLNQTN